MRKYLLSLAMFATTFVVSAQENQESIKPESGSFSVEVGFTPLQTNSVSLQGGQIKGAYSISDKFGVRLGLDFGTSTTTVDNNESGVAWSKTSNCTTQFTVNPGVTYSFAGTERLTPYVGAEVSFGISSKTEPTEANS